MLTLISYLKKVKDFRQDSGKRYPLWLILLLVIWAMMAGYSGYRGCGDFIKFNQKSLLKTLKIKSSHLPSYSTIRRVMMQVNWDDLLQVFNQWAIQLTNQSAEIDWLAIDGKSLKSTVKNYQSKNQNFVSLVSEFSQTYRTVTGLAQLENKLTSEIKQVQELIKVNPRQGQVFTLDALHCQKKTTSLIIETKNHYLIAVKKNQKKLYNQLVTISQNQPPQSCFWEEDLGHGRKIIREVSVFDTSTYDFSEWSAITTLIQVKRSGSRGTKAYQQTAYYISSWSANAQTFACSIRGHWGIENQLHWVKDVIFDEDNWLIHHFQAATNFSILCTIAINLFR